jgi:hypothetical protein
MKKLVVVTLLSFVFTCVSYAQVKYESDLNLHIYRPAGATSFEGGLWLHGATDIRFGEETHGEYCIEYWDGGLNIYRDYPAPNYGNYKLFVADNGNVGIGYKPSYKLDVNGDIATYGTLRIASDIQFKADIQSLKSSLGNIQLLEGVSFIPAKQDTIWYKDAQDNKLFKVVDADLSKKASRRFGFVAQDVKEVFPELVSKDAKGYLNVDYIGLIPVMVEALKEQQKQIDDLEAKLYGENQLLALSASAKATGVNAPKAESCRLYQNIPNPFTGQTEIKYTVSPEVKESYICVFDLQGKMLQRFDTLVGSNSVYIEGSKLPAGMYLYSLIADGQEVDTKRMVLTK